MSDKEQQRRNRTCAYALKSVNHFALKVTTDCPVALPVMASLKTGNFYVVEKVTCKDCPYYKLDEQKEAEYHEARRKADAKSRTREKYTW